MGLLNPCEPRVVPLIPLQLYTVFHLNLTYSSIEEEQRADVIRRCYWPLLKLIRKGGIPLSIEASALTLETVRALDDGWVHELKRLIGAGLCEFIGSGYAQVIGPLVPAEVNTNNQQLGMDVYEELLQIRPEIALVNEQAYSCGLIRHYLDAGYKAILMEWDNPAQHHPEWNPEWRYFPQIACGQHGEKIPLIWNYSIAFQKFQRYAHGDLDLEEYLGYLGTHVGSTHRALALYGNDAEIFDFRPGRFSTEAALQDVSEWARMGAMFERLASDDRFCFVRPSDVLSLFGEEGSDHELHLESAQQPVPVKKQRKYNITRWGVTGRDDLGINTRCYRIYQKLRERAEERAEGGKLKAEVRRESRSNVGASSFQVSAFPLHPSNDWKELCFLWSSDVRTHITEKRWKEYQERLDSFERQLGVRGPEPRGGHAVQAATARGCEDLPEGAMVRRDGRHLRIDTDRACIVLNCKKGLTVEKLWFKCTASDWLCGTLGHGYFDQIGWGADFYTGHMIFETSGYPKITDLCPVEPQVSISEDAKELQIRAELQTDLGPVEKTVIVDLVSGRVTFDYRCCWTGYPPGSLRLLNLTLNPDAFAREELFYRVHNGGYDAEVFRIGDQEVEHGRSVSFLVSAGEAVGITGGTLDVGDSKQFLRVTVDQSAATLLGMLTLKNVGDRYFCRVALSAREMDETSRALEKQDQSIRRFRVAIEGLSRGV